MLFELLALGNAATVAGSAPYGSPGTYPFTVPDYTTLTVVVGGAGGGGGGIEGGGGNGGPSSFAGAVIGGGGGGGSPEASVPTNGAAGGASGGDVNSPGGGPGGGIGEISRYFDKFGEWTGTAGDGGAGGRAEKTYTAGQLTPGAVLSVVVGAAGGPGAPAGSERAPTAGGNGYVWISWT